MEKTLYIGLHVRKKAGGLICFYSPDWYKPRFWYYKAGDSIGFISSKVSGFSNDFSRIVVHINDVEIECRNCEDTFNQMLGMFYGMSSGKDLTVKHGLDMSRIQCRVMHLLDIHKKKDFQKKMISKIMHENQYNSVYETTSSMSNQARNNHMLAYLLAYYGYLKDKIRAYNRGDNYGKKTGCVTQTYGWN